MNLREYLRNEFYNNIRPLFLKDKCESCGSTEDLELHHVDRFSHLLNETLSELSLIEKDTNEYKKEELNSITHYMNSKQLKIKYKTLCMNCHDKIHSKNKPNIKKIETNKFYYTNIDLAKKCNVSKKTIDRWNKTLENFKIIEFTGDYDYFCIDENGILFDCNKEEYQESENRYYFRTKKYKTNTNNQMYIDTYNLIKAIYGNAEIDFNFEVLE